MNKSLVTETPDELVYLSESDLMGFKELLAGTYYPADRKYNIICFLATQAVEKLMKGYIIQNGEKIDKTHNLDYLCKTAMKIDASFKEIKNNCLSLYRFSHNVKYSTNKTITKQDIEKIAQSLEIICGFQPLKTMRDSFSKKHKYEIVASVISSHSKPASGHKNSNNPNYDIIR